MQEARRNTRRLVRSMILATVLAVVVYASFAFLADVRKLGDAIRGFSWPMLGLAFVLASGNYALRFVKWHYYLRCLEIRLPALESFFVFLSGFVMAVTPGKFGEVIKSVLLKERMGVSVARSAPIVLAERLTDLIAILLLSLAGAVTFRHGWIFVTFGFGLTLAIVLAVTVRPLGEGLLGIMGRLPVLGRFSGKLREAYESTALMARPARLIGPVLVSVAAWFCECAAFFFVVRGFDIVELDLYTATFIYAFSTAAGALAMMPGGLGVTEGGLTGLLLALGSGHVGRPAAVGATILTRIATLWFAVLVGFLALGIYDSVWLNRAQGARRGS